MLNVIYTMPVVNMSFLVLQFLNNVINQDIKYEIRYRRGDKGQATHDGFISQYVLLYKRGQPDKGQPDNGRSDDWTSRPMSSA